MTRSAGADAVVAELVRKDYCTDDEGNPKQSRLTVTGAASGGWYWISGERNAAVAPLMCGDLLGGPSAVDPGGIGLPPAPRSRQPSNRLQVVSTAIRWGNTIPGSSGVPCKRDQVGGQSRTVPPRKYLHSLRLPWIQGGKE